MNDEEIEQNLRRLPQPELPEAWRESILATARREASIPPRTSETWPAVLVYLRRLFAQNPLTAGALTTLWLLIFVFKASTPVDPEEKELLAHYDPNQPVHLVSLRDEIQLAQLLQDRPDHELIP